MTNEDAVNMMGQLRVHISGGGVIDRKLDEAVQMAIEALKELGNKSQEVNNSNDCISRQAVRFIESNSDSYPEEWNDDYEKGFTDALNKVIALPSAQPEETCDTCKYGYFGDGKCDYCRERYPSHYERRHDGN